MRITSKFPTATAKPVPQCTCSCTLRVRPVSARHTLSHQHAPYASRSAAVLVGAPWTCTCRHRGVRRKGHHRGSPVGAAAAAERCPLVLLLAARRTGRLGDSAIVHLPSHELHRYVGQAGQVKPQTLSKCEDTGSAPCMGVLIKLYVKRSLTG